jgi:hypothetical protein
MPQIRKTGFVRFFAPGTNGNSRRLAMCRKSGHFSGEVSSGGAGRFFDDHWYDGVGRFQGVTDFSKRH